MTCQRHLIRFHTGYSSRSFSSLVYAVQFCCGSQAIFVTDTNELLLTAYPQTGSQSHQEYPRAPSWVRFYFWSSLMTCRAPLPTEVNLASLRAIASYIALLFPIDVPPCCKLTWTSPKLGVTTMVCLSAQTNVKFYTCQREPRAKERGIHTI